MPCIKTMILKHDVACLIHTRSLSSLIERVAYVAFLMLSDLTLVSRHFGRLSSSLRGVSSVNVKARTSRTKHVVDTVRFRVCLHSIVY